tara:strand:- start:189 stop:1169 length:981 start_codon:yes stop_codon:yes gene_type:complete
MPGKAITYKKAEKAMETVAAYMKQGSMADMKTMAKSTYAEAKKNNPNLDKLIEKRKGLDKGTPEYNAVQNKINKAYGKGPQRDETIKIEPKKAAKIEAKAPKAPKAKSTMEKAEDAIKAGDAKSAKQAIKDSDMKGKVKRKVKRVAAQEARKTKRQTKKNERVDKKIEKLEAKKSPMARYGGGETPAAYFKQKIKYNNSAKGIAIRVAADEKDKKHASKAGKKRLDKDISSMISHASMKDTNTMRYDKTNSMRYDKTNSMRYDTNAKRYDDSMAKAHHGMAKKMHGMPKMKTNQDGGGYAAKNMAAPGKQLKKLGSILSKHFKSNR